MTPRPVNMCVSSVCLKFSKRSIYSTEFILILLSRSLYFVICAYTMVGAGVLGVITLGYGAVILRASLGGSGFPTLCYGYVCTTFRGVTGFSGGFKIRLQVVSGIPIRFHQCVQILPQEWDVVMHPLNIHQPEKQDYQKT